MNEVQPDPFANLANLRRELKRVEHTASLECAHSELRQARENLISSIGSFNNSRYHLGRTIARYKAYFKAEHTWVEAAKAIAGAINSSERTVYRLLECYEHAAQLPEVTVEAMVEKNLDPAAARNAPVIEDLLQMPKPASREQADEQVKVVHLKHVVEKKQQRTKRKAKPDEEGIEVFAARVVRQFEQRYRFATPETRDTEVRYVLESIVNALHADIRELRRFSPPALVTKPTLKEAA